MLRVTPSHEHPFSPQTHGCLDLCSSSHTRARALAHTHTHVLTLIPLTHTVSPSHIPLCPLSHSHTLAYTPSLTLTHTLTLTHSLTHSHHAFYSAGERSVGSRASGADQAAQAGAAIPPLATKNIYILYIYINTTVVA